MLLAPQVLWHIGSVDHSTNEFGLAPNSYAKYAEDPLYVVGESRPNEWPYALPGPSDPWAGNKAHDAMIAFGLASVGSGDYHLQIHLADSHESIPPVLALNLNGKRLASWQAPNGNGDDSIKGQPSKGKESLWSVTIPRKDVRLGTNLLTIQNHNGSWVLFDALSLEAPADAVVGKVQPAVFADVLPSKQAIYRSKAGPVQHVELSLTSIGPTKHAKVSVEGASSVVDLRQGNSVIDIPIKPVAKSKQATVLVQWSDRRDSMPVRIEPVRPWTIYLMPHSHVDIGYTDIQTNVEKLHRRNLLDALTVAAESKSFPPDARYKFNIEAVWPLEKFLDASDQSGKNRVIQALRDGTLSCVGSYCNELTGLMRPEELLRQFVPGLEIANRYGLTFDTASLTDVPGVTWGEVAAMRQAGVKYLVCMPNPADRLGGFRKWLQDKPFWWVSPSGQERVLFWETESYGTAHGQRGFNGDTSKIFRTKDPTHHFLENYLFERLNQLSASNYPYDMLALPWSLRDNAPIDGDVPYAVKAWNEKYVTPRVITSSFSEACKALVSRYGTKLPTRQGDITPYWEDGAGSSAAETALNRRSADRLVQDETLAAMLGTKSDLGKPWRDTTLYSEHTWGAYNSISEPNSEFVKKQWAIKRQFAIDAATGAKRHDLAANVAVPIGYLSVVNTCSWPRTDLILLSKDQSKSGDRVLDLNGNRLSSQRLRTGQLAVLVQNVPAFGSVRIRVVAGKASVRKGITQRYQIQLDPATGSLQSVRDLRSGWNLIKPGTNRYEYLIGGNLKDLQFAHATRMTRTESGPLVQEWSVESQAPGANSLVQCIRVVAGLDRVDIVDTIDKKAVFEKESVHIPFDLNVPNGQVRVHTPWAVVRPNVDQLPGANKNWFCTQRYVDVSNGSRGVVWTSPDAPLVEVGSITANLMGGVYNPMEWVQTLPKTQRIYSWALNNHWYTNYLAAQEGKLTFRYSLQGHGPFESDQAERFGTDVAQPLLVASLPVPQPPVVITNPKVLATSLKKSADGHALILRLWGATGTDQSTLLRWRPGYVKSTSATDLSEQPGKPVSGKIRVPAWGIVTVRAEIRNPN